MSISPETSLITGYLTGLFNRRFFNAMLLNEVSRATRHRVPLTMLLADLDHMKEANQLHGHIFGDKILKILASILASSIRQEDVVARYGADEFAILLPHTDLRGGQVLRERLQNRIDTADALSALGPPEFKVSIKVGVCQYSGEAMETFIAGAEQALWLAKRGGDDNELSVPVSV
jgi:diguanylate cyclase (GGDEF)-like protein